MAEADRLRALLRQDAPLAGATLHDVVMRALQLDLAAEVVERLERDVSGAQADNPRSWHLLALACRARQDSAAAHDAFRRAAALAPGDRVIAHGLARTALDAGWPAARLFQRARTLAPGDPDVLLGHASARLAEGDAQGARTELLRALSTNPGWTDGHACYARLTAFSAPDEAPDRSLVEAMRQRPDDWGLRAQALRLALQARDHARGLVLIEEARRIFGDQLELTRVEAICHSELGRATLAQELFDGLPPPPSAATLVAPIRNLIRLGRYDAAARLAETCFDPVQDRALWPYRALLWRRLDDPRWAWLEGDARLIAPCDLGGSAAEWRELAACLDRIHAGSGEQLDQSVRGGSQTDGDLFARAEPEIRRLRDAIRAATEAYVAGLPAPVPGHPTLIAQRGPIRFAGAWSVRLRGQGFHADHIHQEGWLSSACYVHLPDDCGTGEANGHDGWLAFGENRDLMPDFPAFRLVRPEVGRLVLFPSLTWHGTRPFAAGERLTVAFDVALPG